MKTWTCARQLRSHVDHRHAAYSASQPGNPLGCWQNIKDVYSTYWCTNIGFRLLYSASYRAEVWFLWREKLKHYSLLSASAIMKSSKIGHFRVPCASVSKRVITAKPFLWEWLVCMKMKLHSELMRVGRIADLSPKHGKGFGNWAAHPHPIFRGVPTPGFITNLVFTDREEN